MKRIFSLICISGALIFYVGLAGAGKHLPNADPDQLWDYMTESNPYEGWGYWPGYTEIYPGKSPHGKYLKLYANSLALKAVRSGKPMPNGAILVKENYGKDKKTLMAITPMYKIDGYNPEGGDWYWVKYGPKGRTLAAGQPKGCVACHKAVKGNDWIFAEPK